MRNKFKIQIAKIPDVSCHGMADFVLKIRILDILYCFRNGTGQQTSGSGTGVGGFPISCFGFSFKNRILRYCIAL